MKTGRRLTLWPLRCRGNFVYDTPSLFEKKYSQIKVMFGKVIASDSYGDETTEARFTKKGIE